MQTHAVLQLGNKFDGIIIQSRQINSVCLRPQSCFKYARCTLGLIKVRISMFGVLGLPRLNFAKKQVQQFQRSRASHPYSATAARQAHLISPVNARLSVRTAASRVATGSGGTQGAEEDETSFPQGWPQAKCVLVTVVMINTPRKLSHRISRDHPERGFYKLRPANKTDH